MIIGRELSSGLEAGLHMLCVKGKSVKAHHNPHTIKSGPMDIVGLQL